LIHQKGLQTALTPPLSPEWNDSLSGYYLWSSVNFGEAVSEVMTPLTWSLLCNWRREWNMAGSLVPFGSIGGRLYLNASYFATALHVAGRRGAQIPAALQSTLHIPLPENVEIPRAALTVPQKLVFILNAVRDRLRWAEIARRLPQFIAANPPWCQAVEREIHAVPEQAQLAGIWRAQLHPRGAQAYLGVLSSAMRFTEASDPVKLELTRLVGAEEAEILLSSLGGAGEPLASLAPLAGLEQLQRGEISAADYHHLYGHRGSNEWELFTPRPVEDPAWLNQAAQGLLPADQTIAGMLQTQRAQAERAWSTFHQKDPRQAHAWRVKADEAARRGRLREAARSELVRVIWTMRQWALRAGELSGAGEDIFFMPIHELLAYLEGNCQVVESASKRKAIYRQLKALPRYPSTILGSFDPFAWAADPHRSADFFPVQPAGFPAGARASAMTGVMADAEAEIIRGSPGSAGRAEGTARVLHGLEEGGQLELGEILVTALTDIGWTPLFPRAAAVVTDIGAALSHAAIVARELGIPAVVGCGDATSRIRTGDLIRVDGARGTVEILQSLPPLQRL
jgi:pyruvate,water dikinase